MSTNNSPDRRKFSRRDILKMFGIAAASPLLPRNIALGRRAHDTDAKPKEKLEIKKWTRTEILAQPIEFLDEILEPARLKKLKSKIPESSQATLDNLVSMFSVHKDLNLSPKEVQDRNRLRKEFETGYALYGKKVAELADRADALAPDQNIAPVYKGNFNSLTIWWHSLEVLNRVFNDENGGYEQSFHNEELEELRQLTEWFSTLTKSDSYESQRNHYVEKASKSFPKLIDSIKENWAEARKKPEATQGGISESRTKENEQIFLKILETIHKKFPAAFFEVSMVDFNLSQENRSNFQHSGIFLDSTFFWLMDALEKVKWNTDDAEKRRFGAWAARLVEFLGYVLCHELGHKKDVNDYPPRIMREAHPRDFLEFTEARIKILENFNNFVNSTGEYAKEVLTLEEIEMWFLDPLSPKDFGIDQIASEGQLEVFKYQCSEISDILKLLERLPKEKRDAIISNSGIENLFRNSGKTMTLWETELHDYPVIEGKQRKTKTPFGQTQTEESGFSQISKLDGLSSQVLKDMQLLAEEVWRDEKKIAAFSTDVESDKTKILKSLLKLKSAFQFMIYVILERAMEGKLIDHSTPESSELVAAHHHFRNNYIHRHLLHSMVGPYGEYMPDNAHDTLLISPKEQVHMAIDSAWGYRSNIDRKHGTRLQKQTRLIHFLEKTNRALLTTQETMAKAMGVQPEPGFEINDLYEKLGYELISNLGPDIMKYYFSQSN